MTKNNQEKIKQLLTQGVEEIIEAKSLEQKLLLAKVLRVKHGIDPTGEKLHLGHANVLWKLKQFQDLGHQVVIIIGDYTAQIGDPSDKLQKRPFLSLKQIKANMRTYKKQIGMILNVKKVEWRYNSEWLAKLTPRELDELAELFSAQQMIARRNFKERWEKGVEISLRELHYPLYQGYDSVAVKADIEIGGSDQLFNLLAGRKIQIAYHQLPQDIMTLKMLDGLDGDKMSKATGNVINFADPANEIYGKVMSMSDTMILKYFELCTKVPAEEIAEMERKMRFGANPKEYKEKLAQEIVSRYDGNEAAQMAREEFNKIFKDKGLPSKIQTYLAKEQKYKIIDLLVLTELATSKSKARQLIEQKAVKVDGEIIADWQKEIFVRPKMILQVGPRHFVQLTLDTN